MKYIKRTGRTELSNKDFNLAIFYKDYVILDNACLISKQYIDFTDSLPARHLLCKDHQPICFNTETKEFNGWKPPAEELDQLIDRASNAGNPIRKTELYCTGYKITNQLFTNLEDKTTQWLDKKYVTLFQYIKGEYSQHSKDSYIMLHHAGELIGLIMPIRARAAEDELDTLIRDLNLEPVKEIA